LLTALQQHYQKAPSDEPVAQRVEQARRVLEATTIYSFRKSGGDDASCMNLYQAGQPQILGVPGKLIERDGFRFIDHERLGPEIVLSENPWFLLATRRQDGSIPVIAEQNTLTWMLKKDLGDDLEIKDETGRAAKLHVVGVLKDSVFQSEL